MGNVTRAGGSKMLPVAMQSSVTSVLPTPTTDLTSQLWQLLQFGLVYTREKICKRMNPEKFPSIIGLL